MVTQDVVKFQEDGAATANAWLARYVCVLGIKIQEVSLLHWSIEISL